MKKVLIVSIVIGALGMNGAAYPKWTYSKSGITCYVRMDDDHYMESEQISQSVEIMMSRMNSAKEMGTPRCSKTFTRTREGVYGVSFQKVDCKYLNNDINIYKELVQFLGYCPSCLCRDRWSEM
jgi:hypothetical protein